MEKLIFHLYVIVSSIKYYIYRAFYKGGKFKRLPFHSYNAGKIYDWQQREKEIYYELKQKDDGLCYDLNHRLMTTDHMKLLLKLQSIRDWVVRNIEYKKDITNYNKREHWATTYEILKRKTGDCEDQAFVMYRKMTEAGFPRNKIGIINVKRHAFACYHFSDDDFYILDNGYLTSNVVKATEFFHVNLSNDPKVKSTIKLDKEIQPVVGFNVGNQWSYK